MGVCEPLLADRDPEEGDGQQQGDDRQIEDDRDREEEDFDDRERHERERRCPCIKYSKIFMCTIILSAPAAIYCGGRVPVDIITIGWLGGDAVDAVIAVFGYIVIPEPLKSFC